MSHYKQIHLTVSISEHHKNACSANSHSLFPLYLLDPESYLDREFSCLLLIYFVFVNLSVL